MDSATRDIIGMAGAILVVLLILRLAWRGRYVGEGIRCARCEYLLTGLPDSSSRCPECGAEVSLAAGHNVRTGSRRRMPAMIVLCIALLAVGCWWEQRQVQAWFDRPAARKPTWLLMRELDGTKSYKHRMAVAELLAREPTGGLTESQYHRLVDAVLSLPSPPNGWIYQQRARGHVTDPQWKRFFDDQPPTYSVRALISASEPFKLHRMTSGPSVGSENRLDYRIESVAIDGRPLASRNYNDDLIDLAAELPDLAPGRHQLTVMSSAWLSGKPWRGARQWTGPSTMAFQYRIDGRPTLTRLTSDQDVLSLKQAVTPRLHYTQEGQLWLDMAYPVNLPMCHDVYVSDGKTETHMLTIIGSPGDTGGGGPGWGPTPKNAASLDVILRPNARTAAATVHLTELVNREIVYKDVPVAPALK